MKVRKKQNNAKINYTLPDVAEKSKTCFLKSEEFEDLSEHILNVKDETEKEERFNSVEQLDIMDISVSNFQFANFNKIELDSLDIINEEDCITKEELFHTVVADLVSNSNKDIEENNSLATVQLVGPKDIEDSNSNIQKDGDVIEEETPKLSKRALKRKKQLEESKLQCPVRTTARHYTKMFEFFEANPGLATGQLPKVIYRKKWHELTDILNQQGIGEKTTEKWQKTWSDYKLHLRKKLSGIKRSGKALNVPNQFTEQDKRALSNIGVSLCDEDSMKNAIKKRFNPDLVESEDSSSHSTIQSTTNNLNIPQSTRSLKRSLNYIRKQKYRQITERHKKLREFRAKTIEYQKRNLKELKSLKNNFMVKIFHIIFRYPFKVILNIDFQQHCQFCYRKVKEMSSVSQAAFAVSKVKKNEEKRKDITYTMKLSPTNYSSKFMNSIWGQYNRYSVHNLKQIMNNNNNIFSLKGSKQYTTFAAAQTVEKTSFSADIGTVGSSISSFSEKKMYQ